MLKLGLLCVVALGAAALLARRDDDGAPPAGPTPLLPFERHEDTAEGRLAILTRGFFLDPYAYADGQTVH